MEISLENFLIWPLPGPPAFAREASEGCRAEARRAKAGRCASYGSASQPAIIIGKDSGKADAVLAPN
jgi:hypothetical protein